MCNNALSLKIPLKSKYNATFTKYLHNINPILNLMPI